MDCPVFSRFAFAVLHQIFYFYLLLFRSAGLLARIFDSHSIQFFFTQSRAQTPSGGLTNLHSPCRCRFSQIFRHTIFLLFFTIPSPKLLIPFDQVRPIFHIVHAVFILVYDNFLLFWMLDILHHL